MKFPPSGRFSGDLNGGNGIESQKVVVWPSNFTRSWGGFSGLCLHLSFDLNRPSAC